MSDAQTHIANVLIDRIEIRGYDLVDELIGKHSYTEMVFFLLRDRFPTPAETKALDAVLVTLMEHGLTPSALIARLAAHSVPSEVQVAMTAGLVTVGNVFAGTMEDCARLLKLGVASGEPAADYCERLVRDYRERRAPVPGFGHPHHKPDDPRTPRLLDIARESGLAGRYVEFLLTLSAVVDRIYQKHLTINATGMIGALLLEMGFEPDIMRGLAVISRAGGLLAHVQEEQQTDSVRALRKAARDSIPYVAPEPKKHR
ncbi:citryl-CoA lyase [Paraburkholderia caballeronis]|uniref:citrate synthase (unknown stereospecificity) n=1 Tax=Paraburkholderia caballeronis TaxID=416943 RepID=A0A1H7JAM9_9BURK|nr:citryl-CoA lyase [Paraburkholderia caballeronis]PXW27498.1 citrate synthase [Paraburkholderia caballeronis]PXX02972.1 citrate synthase [Paraburkholderia caballeronis]RAK03697.1 citrate synthase [Paraburkholderia caballeronis]TDV06126.1 citrate synthase [Paraburkholderia caballeronis]TDV09666.1 citrate synthase [Paraburkholderia caballeronis]